MKSFYTLFSTPLSSRQELERLEWLDETRERWKLGEGGGNDEWIRFQAELMLKFGPLTLRRVQLLVGLWAGEVGVKLGPWLTAGKLNQALMEVVGGEVERERRREKEEGRKRLMEDLEGLIEEGEE